MINQVYSSRESSVPGQVYSRVHYKIKRSVKQLISTFGLREVMKNLKRVLKRISHIAAPVSLLGVDVNLTVDLIYIYYDLTQNR